MTDLNDPGLLTARKLWWRLEPGREYELPANYAGVSGCDPFLDAVDDLRQPLIRGDVTYVHLLVGHGFVTTRLSEDGRTFVYKVAEVEPPVDTDTRSWVEREQEKINQQVAFERQQMDREYELRQQARRILDEPIIRSRQREIWEGLQAFGVDAHALADLPDRLAALEAAVLRIERHLGVHNDDSDGQEARVEVTQ